MERLGQRGLDLLVVGGGIVGAGVARDAALRGLRVGLVEQADFASGTSSRTSRLLHGGLRYLAQGHVRLVREASREKGIIARTAPHLTEPLPFLFPTRRKSSWPKWQLRIGVKIYDWLCGGQNLGPSTALDAPTILDMLPGLNPDGLTGGVRYFDALTNDARLVIDTLRSAERRGAVLRNYCPLEHAEREGKHWTCRVRDLNCDEAHLVATRTVINATGPWSDCLPHSGTHLRLTKGVHLVVDRERLPVPDAVVMPEGNRILFAIPWGERIIVGTTDTDYDGPLERPLCEAEDMQYILAVIADNFPEAAITPRDVISTWAGLRPLVADPTGRPSDISRRHEIKMNEPGWWDVTGGKLTTHRLMAEQSVDAVVRYLNLDAGACRTAHEPLLETGDVHETVGVVPPPVREALVRHFCSREWARHLDDVMIRRTGWRYYHRDHGSIADRVLGWMADRLDWDDTRRNAEQRRYQQVARDTSVPSAAEDG